MPFLGGARGLGGRLGGYVCGLWLVVGGRWEGCDVGYRW
jgi:hypothetical protein